MFWCHCGWEWNVNIYAEIESVAVFGEGTVSRVFVNGIGASSWCVQR